MQEVPAALGARGRRVEELEAGGSAGALALAVRAAPTASVVTAPASMALAPQADVVAPEVERARVANQAVAAVLVVGDLVEREQGARWEVAASSAGRATQRW